MKPKSLGAVEFHRVTFVRTSEYHKIIFNGMHTGRGDEGHGGMNVTFTSGAEPDTTCGPTLPKEVLSDIQDRVRPHAINLRDEFNAFLDVMGSKPEGDYEIAFPFSLIFRVQEKMTHEVVPVGDNHAK
jgi:hypothetical protein